MKSALIAIALLGLVGCMKKKTAIATGPVEWEPVALPVPAGYAKVVVKSVRGTGPDDVWVLAAAQRTDDRGAPYGLSFHFDGTTWRAAEVPARATKAIWPVSPTEAWAVGAYGTVARWDGQRWTATKIEGVDFDLLDVVAWHDDVWVAAAGPELLHFDGARWRKEAPPELAGTSVHEVFGEADGTVLVPRNLAGKVPAVLRRSPDGAWRLDEVGPGGVVHLAGSSPADRWAIGAMELAYHSDGRAWRATPLAGTRTLGAWATSPTEAYLVGVGGSIQRWDGAAWQPSASGTDADLWTVFAPPGMKPLVGGAAGLLRRK
ncbi:MAG: hypothetical protein K8W52_30835 [Deltaproteobacteria bacterium]|nr:hypothetical protein [Deltaproteobacteria bacterium]